LKRLIERMQAGEFEAIVAVLAAETSSGVMRLTPDDAAMVTHLTVAAQ
jgi:hypothetical protein